MLVCSSRRTRTCNRIYHSAMWNGIRAEAWIRVWSIFQNITLISSYLSCFYSAMCHNRAKALKMFPNVSWILKLIVKRLTINFELFNASLKVPNGSFIYDSNWRPRSCHKFNIPNFNWIWNQYDDCMVKNWIFEFPEKICIFHNSSWQVLMNIQLRENDFLHTQK